MDKKVSAMYRVYCVSTVPVPSERRPFHTQVHGEVHGERELPNQIRALNPLNSSDTGVFSPSSSGRGGTGGSFLSARFMERGGPVTGS
jgi:hypothetical protein